MRVVCYTHLRAARWPPAPTVRGTPKLQRPYTEPHLPALLLRCRSWVQLGKLRRAAPANLALPTPRVSEEAPAAAAAASVDDDATVEALQDVYASR